MKKWFVICVAAVFILMFLSMLLIDYEELGSRRLTVAKWKWAFYLFGILTGFGLFELFKKEFPIDHKTNSRLMKIIFPIGLMFFCCGMTFQSLSLVNSFHNTGFLIIHGKIVDRYKEKRWTGRRTGFDYHLVVDDTVMNARYEFNVSQEAYDFWQNTEQFNLECKIGWLGIIYRNKQ